MVSLRSVKFNTRVYITQNGKEQLCRFMKGSKISTEVFNPDGYKAIEEREKFYDNSDEGRAEISERVGVSKAGLKFKKGTIKKKDNIKSGSLVSTYTGVGDVVTGVVPKTEEDAFGMYLNLTDAESYGFVSSGKDLKIWLDTVKKDKDAWNVLRGKMYVEDHGGFCVTKIALREEEREALQNYIDDFSKSENVMLTLDTLFTTEKLKGVNLYSRARVEMIEEELEGYGISSERLIEANKRYGKVSTIGLKRDDYRKYKNILDGKVLIGDSIVASREEMLKFFRTGFKEEIEAMAKKYGWNKSWGSVLDAVETISKFGGVDGVKIGNIDMALNTLKSYAEELKELAEKNKILEVDNETIKNMFHEINEAYEKLSGENKKMSVDYEEKLEGNGSELRRLGGIIYDLEIDNVEKDSSIDDLTGERNTLVRDKRRLLESVADHVEREKLYKEIEKDKENTGLQLHKLADEIAEKNKRIKEVEKKSGEQYDSFNATVINLKDQRDQQDVVIDKLKVDKQSLVTELENIKSGEFSEIVIGKDKEIGNLQKQIQEKDTQAERVLEQIKREKDKYEKVIDEKTEKIGVLNGEIKEMSQASRVTLNDSSVVSEENLQKQQELEVKQEQLEVGEQELRVARHKLGELEKVEKLREEDEEERETVFSEQLEGAREEFRVRETEFKARETELKAYEQKLDKNGNKYHEDMLNLKKHWDTYDEQKKEIIKREATLQAREDAVKVDDDMNNGIKNTNGDKEKELAKAYEVLDAEQLFLNGEKGVYQENLVKYQADLEAFEKKKGAYQEELNTLMRDRDKAEIDKEIARDARTDYEHKLVGLTGREAAYDQWQGRLKEQEAELKAREDAFIKQQEAERLKSVSVEGEAVEKPKGLSKFEQAMQSGEHTDALSRAQERKIKNRN